jgi:nuclear pore complex protein Nup107
MSPEPESPLFPDDVPLQETLDSVRAVGERISKEVEEFAMNLDQWLEKRNKLDAKDTKGNIDAAMEIIGKLKNVATTRHTHLKREHDHTRRRENLSSSWQGRIQGVADRAGRSASIGSGNALSAYGTSEVMDELHQWQSEVNTWDLFKTIADYEVNKLNPEHKETYIERNPTDQFTEGADLWTHFIFLNDLAREKKVVLEWLERCAQNGETNLDAIVEQLEKRAGAGQGTWSSGWLYTREKIKAYKRLRSIAGATPEQASISATDSSRLLVTQLDPDAPTRQERILEKKDEYYERALWLTSYEMLRRGTPWNQISDWCQEHNESWRAASFGASQDLDRKSSRLCLSGPYLGALWRRMCLKAAHNPTADKYERAVYGLLAGDVQSVEPVCQTWEDSLYMNYNSLLLAEFEDWLQKNHPEKFPSVLAQKIPLYKPVRPFQALAAEHNAIMDATYKQGNFGEDPDMPMKHLQAALVSHKFKEFALELAKAIRKKANSEKPSLLIANNHMLEKVDLKFLQIAEDWDVIRIAAHMVIVYRTLGLEYADEEAVDDIIVTYMDFLRTLGKFDAIPTYALCLNSDATRNRILGAMISDITDKSEQDRLVQLMNAAGLDMTAILSAQWVHALAVLGITVLPPDENLPGPNETIHRFELVEPASEQWAGWRIRDTGLGSLEIDERPVIDLLDSDEQRLVRSLEWFFIIRADWAPTFAGIATVMKALLRTGRFMAALAITTAIPYHAMSKHLTPDILNGRSVDVHEDPEYIESESTEVSAPPAELRRSTRSSSQRESALVAKKEPTKDEIEWPFTIAMLKQQSKQVVELQMLCSILEALAMWRFLEDNLSGDMHAHLYVLPSSLLQDIPLTTTSRPLNNRAMLVHQTLQEDIVIRMAPLFDSFLTDAVDGSCSRSLITKPFTNVTTIETDDFLLRKIRYAYIPDILLAYNGIITYTSTYGEKEVLFKSLDLANAIADDKNYELANAFLRTGRMGELVTALALSQRMLLRLNQQEKRLDKKTERDLELRKRREEGTDVLFGEGKGDLVSKKGKAKVRSLKKKRSELLSFVGEEERGQDVDIWAPR